MKLYIGVTDNDWFRFLRARKPAPTEANFWQPSGSRDFRALQPGQPFLFKLHSPENYIAGGGFFAHFSILPFSLAWEVFGQANGTATIGEMRRRIEKYRHVKQSSQEDYPVGCILLTAPFFFDEKDWIPAPGDFTRNIVSGKGYETDRGTGAALWAEVRQRLERIQAEERQPVAADDAPAETAELPLWAAYRDHLHFIDGPLHGDPVLVRPRLGQGTFRVVITDVYDRHCAVTGEKVLPVLEAAHIKPVADGGRHEISNGLLLRSDLHRLFDRGYITVTPDYRLLVSRRLKDDFHNGEEYYQLKNRTIWLPSEPKRPHRELLEWHGDTVFKK
ncbi:MAG TPA: HNH endonuclease [Acidobacteriota bacterium]|nr:HNH endonuclease [Acidobacteriota bacterium]